MGARLASVTHSTSDAAVLPEPRAPRIVALGGSTKPMAASERALRIAGAAAAAFGADVRYVTGRDLLLPLYDTETDARSAGAIALVEALGWSDGVLLASPGYHGSVSGMVKNALDYAEDLRHEDRPYLEGRAVGIVAVAHGWQTAVGTMNQLRLIVHALRGWPTPLAVAINDAAGLIGSDAESSDPAVARQLHSMAAQVVAFARGMGPRTTTA